VGNQDLRDEIRGSPIMSELWKVSLNTISRKKYWKKFFSDLDAKNCVWVTDM